MHLRAGAAIVLTTLATQMGFGCAGDTSIAVDRVGPISPSLVMPAWPLRGPAASSADWPQDADRWEHARNDAAMATAQVLPLRQPAWVEIDTRDYLRTTNGRPREFSTTRTRSNTLRVVR